MTKGHYMNETPNIVTREHIEQTITHLRAFFHSGSTRPLVWRIRQLQALHRMLSEQDHRLVEALKADLGKAEEESYLTEISFVKGEIHHMLKSLRRWLKPKKVRLPLGFQPARAKLMYEPLGTVLILAPWNYPVMLLLSPLVGALASGNTVLLKPSEVAGHTAQVLAEIIPQYLDSQAVQVIQTDVQGTSIILEYAFDHIFYTGSSSVGKIIMAAAAKHLTPVTLELGGKSPVWIDDTVDIQAAARRIAWAKFLNAGQTCVAPDYILTTDAVAERLIPELRRAIERLYPQAQNNPDYGQIINQRHTERIQQLLSDVQEKQIVMGGHVDVAQRYIEPTIVDDVALDSKLMQEEIFGPILPIVRVSTLNDAIQYINSQPKPLALYVFSNDEHCRTQMEEKTSSGALCFNFAVAYLGAKNLPFGGVGNSGMGRYMGEYSLLTFGHQKPVFTKPLWLDTLRLVAAPYNRLSRLVAKWFVER